MFSTIKDPKPTRAYYIDIVRNAVTEGQRRLQYAKIKLQQQAIDRSIYTQHVEQLEKLKALEVNAVGAANASDARDLAYQSYKVLNRMSMRRTEDAKSDVARIGGDVEDPDEKIIQTSSAMMTTALANLKPIVILSVALLSFFVYRRATKKKRRRR